MELTRRQIIEGQECFMNAHTSIHSILSKDEPHIIKIVGLESTLMDLHYGTQLFVKNADFKHVDKSLSLECTKEMRKYLESMYKSICELEGRLNE